MGFKQATQQSLNLKWIGPLITVGKSIRHKWVKLMNTCSISVFLYFVDFKVLCLGCIQSLFEGSMYVFVLEWTPALTPEQTSENTDENEGHRGSIPHGHIFAGFMVGLIVYHLSR